MHNLRIYQLIGISQKARRIVSGEFAVKQSVLAMESYLVIIAEDASAKTKKLFKDKCSYRNIPCIEWGTKEGLGHILGKETRAAVGITDKALATKIQIMIQNME